MNLSDAEEFLSNLRWHWGEAYQISFFEPDVWIAVRRDTHDTLRADTPLALRDRIIADYSQKPVPRDTAWDAIPRPRDTAR